MLCGIFQHVMHELGVTQYMSTACHPQSQRALERWHQTLKNMMRIYCFETEEDGDEGSHLRLSAAAESVQESLGFSPFELVFEHTVRGPLKLLKKKLLSSSTESTNLLQYDSDFCSKRFRACELTKANLSPFEMPLKENYDVDAVERDFKSGEKALALLPVPRNKLSCRLFGPYVTQKLNDLKSCCQHASDTQQRAAQVCFSPTLIFCSPICPDTCGVFFFCLCENIY